MAKMNMNRVVTSHASAVEPANLPSQYELHQDTWLLRWRGHPCGHRTGSSAAALRRRRRRRAGVCRGGRRTVRWAVDNPPQHTAVSAANGSGGEVSRLRAELSATKLRLERLEESSRQFIGSITHELRSPITLIQGYVEGILEGVIAEPGKQRRSLELIHSKATGMNRLIADLFQLTALETRHIDFDLRPVAVYELKNHLQDRFELDVEQAGYTLCLSASDIFCDRSMYVHVDVDRLDQVFTNLFTNAIKHLSEDGGQITVAFEHAQTDSAPLLVVRVKDNGSGIEASDLPFVFDRFYRGKAPSTNRGQTGIGLGLSICREIVAAHGGNMCVDSTPGNGAEFVFTIPIMIRAQPVSESP